jgi:oligoribonuclease (3'-5' exoribonuclease)
VASVQKRYVSLSVVTGMVVNNEQVPLEVAVLVLDEQMRPLDAYSTPVIPSARYDLSMVAMYTPGHLTNALESEGLWSTMQVNSMAVEAADRYLADKIERHCDPDTTEVIVLCDHLAPTREAVYRFTPNTGRKLEKRHATWMEIEPLKSFAEVERVYGKQEWNARAAPRARAVANYAFQMRRAMKQGAKALSAAAAS